MNLSVVIITVNEEANLSRTLASVKPLVADGKGEIIVVDSGSTDRTVQIAKSFGANVFVEEWKGYAAQKNSAIDKAKGDWILSLDADEELSSNLAAEITAALTDQSLRENNQGVPDLASDFAGTARLGDPIEPVHVWVLAASQQFFSRAMDQAWRLLARPQDAPVPARGRPI
jgi:glycosyltransferase involved in cell wall biosynthesis